MNTRQLIIQSTFCFLCLLISAFFPCPVAAQVLSTEAPGNEVTGGESFSVDIALDFENSDAGLAVVAANIVTTSNIIFTGFTVKSPAIAASENDFNFALFYPFESLLMGPGQLKVASLQFDTLEVPNDSVETITFSLDNGGGFFFDQVLEAPFTTNQSLTVTLVSSITAVILGDVNQDGEVTFTDIPSFIQVLQAGTFLEQADANEDGEVTFADIPAFIAILQAG